MLSQPIGKSPLYSAGLHGSIVIQTEAINDGDVIRVTLQDEQDMQITDEYNQPIEVVRPVGEIMGHSMDEY